MVSTRSQSKIDSKGKGIIIIDKCFCLFFIDKVCPDVNVYFKNY